MTMLLPLITSGIMFARHKFLGLPREKALSLVLGFLVLVYNGLCTKVLATFMRLAY